MHGFGAHHTFPVHGIFQLAHGLHQNSQLILSYSLFTFFQSAAAWRTTPAFIVFMTGIRSAHLTDFWFQFDGITGQRHCMGKTMGLT